MEITDEEFKLNADCFDIQDESAEEALVDDGVTVNGIHEEIETVWESSKSTSIPTAKGRRSEPACIVQDIWF